MQHYHYSDIFLKQKFSDVKSRSNIDVSVDLGYWKFKSVVVPSNMKSVVDIDLAEKWGENGYFYILHRFMPYEQILEWITKNQSKRSFPISISIGVGQKDEELIQQIILRQLRVDFITVDIAHGWSINMKGMLLYLKSLKKAHETLPYVFNPLIIAGNVMSSEACDDLADWGADFAKVGIACGAACRTYNSTGIGSPMFSTVIECANSRIPIIADGQVREAGDVCKALFAGAKMVMVGSLFAACEDSAAPLVNGKKIYRGSSTYKDHYIEGGSFELDSKGDSINLFELMKEGIQSFLSYRGHTDIKELKYDANGWGVMTEKK